MFGVVVEYETAATGIPDPLARLACQAAMRRRPGYRRQLALTADGWRRAVDLFLFESAESANVPLTDETWQTLAAVRPALRDIGPAILVSEGSLEEAVVILRGKAGTTRGEQACWRDCLANIAPDNVLW